MVYRLSDYDYALNEKMIAQFPPRNIGGSRLMLIDRISEQITHHSFLDLDELLEDSFDLVINNTKVFPARLHGNKSTGGRVEILLLDQLSDTSFQVITKPGLILGQNITFNSTTEAVCIQVKDDTRVIKFNTSGTELFKTLNKIGHTPLPPYIKTHHNYYKRYHTVYEKIGFSSASPTAGLHFSKSHLKRLSKNHSIFEITLNIGLGTFKPVKSQDIRDHLMHYESFSISPSTSTAITRAIESERSLLAVGTTSARAIESSFENGKILAADNRKTNIFIYPPYRFKCTSALLTNFHLPKSTLLMMLSAFTSYPNTAKKFKTFSSSLIGHAYSVAIKNKYRFYSFGDAMLII